MEIVIHEYEPLEAFALLADDDLDLALTYDYNLAPASPGPTLVARTLWSTPVGTRGPARTRRPAATGPRTSRCGVRDRGS